MPGNQHLSISRCIERFVEEIKSWKTICRYGSAIPSTWTRLILLRLSLWLWLCGQVAFEIPRSDKLNPAKYFSLILLNGKNLHFK
jgi:hypothetical protein